MATTIQGRLLRWGNSYGVRLTKADVEGIGLHVGEEVKLEVKNEPGQQIDLSWWKGDNLGGDLSVRHDEADWA